MNDYAFSLAKHEDIQGIYDLYQSLIGTPGCTWNLDYPSSENVIEDIERQSLYVLKDNNKVIAAAFAGHDDELQNLEWRMNNPCDIARVGVSIEKQNLGIGTLILQNVIAAVKDRGFDGIRMMVSKTNPSALALYDKNGFKRCGETVMYDIDFFCYELLL